MQDLENTIRTNWHPYHSDKKCQIETKFKINSNGEAFSIQIISSNASKENNNEAIKTIKKVYFRQLPDSLKEKGEVDINFTFDIK